MKKTLLFLMTCCLSLTMQAKVGYLSGNAFAEDVNYQPEAQAKAWFEATYTDGTVISWDDFVTNGIPSDITTLWVNVDRQGSNWAATGWDNGSGDLTKKVGTFVKNGGQLFVTTHAVLLANLCGRGTQGLAEENWNSGWSQGNDIWQANTNMCERDNSTHAIFKGLLDSDNKKFDLVGADMRTDHNVMWGNIDEVAQGCVRLATWGQETNCDHAGIVEFLPKGDYKGHIIACGLAAYQWGKTNSKIANVQKLTENVIAYLESEDLDKVVYTRATTAGRYGTICLERNAVSVEGATLFWPVDVLRNGDEVTAIVIEEQPSLQAGYGYIFLPDGDELKVTMDGLETPVAEPVAHNPSMGVYTHGMHGLFSGTYTMNDHPNEVILNNNKLWYGANNTVGDHRAWFKLNEVTDGPSASVPGRRRVTMAVNTPNTTTGVENAECKVQSAKLLRDGQLYILRAGAYYTVDGQLVK